MTKEKLDNKKDFLGLSLVSRMIFQIILLTAIVIAPYFSPEGMRFESQTLIILNVLFSLFINIVLELLKIISKGDGQNKNYISNIQIVINSILLTLFLHLTGRINGPFFVLLPLFIIESAYISSKFIQNIIFVIAFVSTLVEYFWMGFTGELTFNIFSLLLLSVRLISLFLMESYAAATHDKIDTEEKAALSLSTVNTKLKNIDKNKDEFIYMAAHELRTPVTAIKGYVSMILEGDAGEIPAKARGYLADVNNINDRLIRLLNNMLNVSKIEEGKLVYQMAEENLSQLTRAVFSQFLPETERKGLDYKLDIPTKIRDKVYVDPDRIQEVIGNLISNAVKYTDKGTIIVRLNQKVKSRVRFEVEDTGSGISEAEQKKLFQKFHRVESNVGKTTGSGLGLYISKLIVEKFKGRIGVTSEVDNGSVFWFDLPVLKS